MLLWFVGAVAGILTFMAPPSEGTGRAIVTLRKYTNPSHRLSNGKCCDHRFLNVGRCRPCDAYFKLCVSQAVSGSSSNSCNIGRSQTGVVGDDDNHVLNIRRAFSFESFKGAITVGVEVWDKDKFTSNDYVGSPSITLWSVTPGLYLDPLRRSLTLKSRYVTMKLDLELYCDKDYYGPSCSVNCVPRDDSSGHYTCDNLGNKICLQRWEGPSCNRCESNWFGPRCSAICVPQDNDFQGHYKQGDKICLSCWEGLSCKRCVKNWFGTGCSTYCVPRDSDELGHYKCSQSDGTKQCLQWWFGSDCKAHCIPHDDDDNGHYSCARDGKKTCHDGWHGENCTVFCIPQDDDIRGHYTCDEEGGKVCLNGYRSPDCMDCLLGWYGADCSLSCLADDTYGFQQGYIYCSDDGVKQCKKWWHGPECLQYCVPHDDNEHGHYTCEPRDGSKVCRPGWEGLSCLNRKKN